MDGPVRAIRQSGIACWIFAKLGFHGTVLVKLPMKKFVPTWRTLKTIGGSRTVALAGFFPFVGYLILANQDLSQLLTLVTDHVHGTVNVEATTDRLRQMYFGMLSLSVGVLLYRVFCPLEISQFGDRYDYIEKELPIATPIRVDAIQRAMQNLDFWQTLLLDSALAKDIEEASKLKIESAEIADLTFPVHEQGKGQKSPKAFQADSGLPILQLLNTNFDMQNSSMGAVRIIASIAFVYGYAKLAWPSLVVAVKLISA